MLIPINSLGTPLWGLHLPAAYLKDSHRGTTKFPPTNTVSQALRAMQLPLKSRELTNPTSMLLLSRSPSWLLALSYEKWSGLDFGNMYLGMDVQERHTPGKIRSFLTSAEDHGGLTFAFGSPSSAGMCCQQTCCRVSEVVTTYWSKFPGSLKSLCSLLFVWQATFK